MKKVMMLMSACMFLSFNALNASADDTVPGAYAQGNNANQVMSVGKTQMMIGAQDRAHANYVNARSGAGRSKANSGNGGGADFQWGEAQQENSWKAAKTFEEAGVHGMTEDDCQGDNSDGVYRAQMNQNRKGYMSEPLVSQAQCHTNHATLK
ncbi:MAG TPA: hypothetical protein EYG21_07865 [Nitrospinaceae bacterium]|nr:hypothetical protein [Nitrospinaceae bacterium]